MNTDSYHIEDNVVRIKTCHFTKFLLKNTKSVLEITDAVITVAAKYYTSDIKAFIDLRLMLHSHCAMLNDFSAVRKQVRTEYVHIGAIYDGHCNVIWRVAVSAH